MALAVETDVPSSLRLPYLHDYDDADDDDDDDDGDDDDDDDDDDHGIGLCSDIRSASSATRCD